MSLIMRYGFVFTIGFGVFRLQECKISLYSTAGFQDLLFYYSFCDTKRNSLPISPYTTLATSILRISLLDLTSNTSNCHPLGEISY